MSVYSTFFACIILDRESVTMHDLGALGRVVISTFNFYVAQKQDMAQQ